MAYRPYRKPRWIKSLESELGLNSKWLVHVSRGQQHLSLSDIKAEVDAQPCTYIPTPDPHAWLKLPVGDLKRVSVTSYRTHAPQQVLQAYGGRLPKQTATDLYQVPITNPAHAEPLSESQQKGIPNPSPLPTVAQESARECKRMGIRPSIIVSRSVADGKRELYVRSIVKHRS